MSSMIKGEIGNYIPMCTIYKYDRGKLMLTLCMKDVFYIWWNFSPLSPAWHISPKEGWELKRHCDVQPISAKKGGDLARHNTFDNIVFSRGLENEKDTIWKLICEV